jgi:hypothetical protein
MASSSSPETAPESGAALWLAVGRLQSDTARLIEGQGNLRADLAETNRRSDETNRRIDRLFYAIVGVGAGVIGTLVAVLMRSG